MCPLCHARNSFPPHYSGISEQNVPAELFPQYTTIEYVLPMKPSQSTQNFGSNGNSPAYLFVIDTVIPEDEIAALATSITQMLSLLPENALVGLITFGTQVNVFELGFTECVKSYCFKGSKKINMDDVRSSLGLIRQQPSTVQKQQKLPTVTNATPGRRFLVQVSDVEFHLGNILEEMQKDPWPQESEKRAVRCTGSAVAVATALLSSTMPSGGGRILCFCGGPCTEGEGQVVAKELEHPIRSHKDLDNGTAPLFEKASKFYDDIAVQLVSSGHVMDVFAGALDQVGLAEMKPSVQSTGGIMILTETFSHQIFKESFQRMFASSCDDSSTSELPVELATHGRLKVLTSRDITISGAIGCCERESKHASGSSTNTPTSNSGISEVEVGIGGTNTWKLCGLDKDTTIAIFFDFLAKNREEAQQMYSNSAQFFIQFQSEYTTSRGEIRLRITTISRRLVDGIDANDMLSGFDQEASAVMLARLVAWKMEVEDDFDATRWLDRMLIQMCKQFATFNKEDPTTFQLASPMSIFPQFMFNLRRSQFIQVFNNSPDETAFYNVILFRENVINSMTMIQPSLTSYSFNAPPEPALLDVAAIIGDRVLVLDTFFSVVLFHGNTVAQWRDAGYAEQPEHAALKELLRAPRADAESILLERFPVPRFVDCDQYGSQARFLLVKLNPSATHNNYGGAPGSDIIFTEDVSLSVFLEHLARLSVAS